MCNQLRVKVDDDGTGMYQKGKQRLYFWQRLNLFNVDKKLLVLFY